MTQFHQEEQKRFYETFTNPENIGYRVGQEFLGAIVIYLKSSNTRSMKHILEELLAEITTDVDDICEEFDMEEGVCGVCASCKVNNERRRVCSILAKKLQDITKSE